LRAGGIEKELVKKKKRILGIVAYSCNTALGRQRQENQELKMVFD